MQAEGVGEKEVEQDPGQGRGAEDAGLVSSRKRLPPPWGRSG